MDPRRVRTRERAVAAASALLDRQGIDALTHARVASEAGIARRSAYRVWPDRPALLHDVLGQIRAPHGQQLGGLRQGLIAHLTAFADALVDGPLGYVLAVLHERSRHDHELDDVRRRLVHAGCAPLRERLADGVASGHLPDDLDPVAAVARLEGPVLHHAILHRASPAADEVQALVDAFIAAPPVAQRGPTTAPAET
ncbi:MAG: TetR/AcrR family transcriptional regulator [Phycicoccus sp.]